MSRFRSLLPAGLIVLAFLLGFIPLLADPILRFSQGTIARVAVGSFLGALFGVLILFAAPVILMAMVSPFAIRLQLKRVEAGIEAAGRTAGSLSALSTVGSIVGVGTFSSRASSTTGSSNGRHYRRGARFS